MTLLTELFKESEARSLKQKQQMLKENMEQTEKLLNATALSLKTIIRDESRLFLKNGVKSVQPAIKFLPGDDDTVKRKAILI